MVPPPMSQRAPRQVMRPATVTTHGCVLATCRACSGCAPTAPDAMSWPKADQLGLASLASAHVSTAVVGYDVARVNCDFCQFPLGFPIEFQFKFILGFELIWFLFKLGN
jgi:hypothetical protein